jgi:hypothetical protein
MDETYIKVAGQWKYLYRAVDREGDTMVRNTQSDNPRQNTAVREGTGGRCTTHSQLRSYFPQVGRRICT